MPAFKKQKVVAPATEAGANRAAAIAAVTGTRGVMAMLNKPRGGAELAPIWKTKKEPR